jgi:hypothetical protein
VAMRGTPVFALVALVLAGCTGSGGGGGDAGPDGTPTPGGTDTPMVCVNSQLEPVAEPDEQGRCPLVRSPTPTAVPVDFTGFLGYHATICEASTGQCHQQVVSPGDSDHVQDASGTILVGVDLTMTWTPRSVVTDTLGLSAAVTGNGTAGPTLIANAEGMSPVELQQDGLDIPLDRDNVFQMNVYNVRGLIHQDPVFGYATTQNEFHVEGTLRVLAMEQTALHMVEE